MSLPSVYLAGPDVFFPDVAARAAAQKALCAELGWQALHPVDQPVLQAATIYENNLQLLRQADVVLANLQAFRGPEVDSGTAFEVGFAVALGKPVLAYVPQAESWLERVGRCYGPVSRGVDGLWRDQAGCLVEDFSLPLNLMLGVACTVVVADWQGALRYLAQHYSP